MILLNLLLIVLEFWYREEDLSSDSKLPANVEMTPVEMQDDNVEQDFEPVLDTDSLHPIKTSPWNIENSDAPKS